MILQEIIDRIPDKDKVCINCDFFVGQNDYDRGDEPNMCHGSMPCLNYHGDHDKNYFVPDDFYLHSEFGCEACEHYAYGEPTEECSQCSDYYSNNWQRKVTA